MFSLLKGLNTHIKTHGPKILKCKYCTHKFKTNKVRRKHERTQHECENNSITNVGIQKMSYDMETTCN